MCGDGSFQMTGPEISHAPMFGTNPIIMVINNGGWGIFRPVADRLDLLTIPPWPYAKLAEDWGGVGFTVTRLSELRAALEAANASKSFAIVEVQVGYHDLSPISLKYIKAAAKRSQTPKGANGARNHRI
jgi:thiamine pyrophosphate-dependent acetolactate synthase large subunit-like protein